MDIYTYDIYHLKNITLQELYKIQMFHNLEEPNVFFRITSPILKYAINLF